MNFKNCYEAHSDTLRELQIP